MTLEESILHQNQLIDKLNRSHRMILQIEPTTSSMNPLSLLQAPVFQIMDRLSASVDNPVHSSIKNAISTMNDSFVSMQLGLSPALHNAITTACQWLSDYNLNSITNSIIISPEIAERLSAAITASQSYLTETQQEKYTDIILPHPTERKATFLTFDRAVSLLGLLIGLYTLIVTSMPNSQLTRISEQNDKLIAIEQERLDLERQQTEHLENIANNLGDIIIYLGEQIEAQGDQFNVRGNQIDSANDTDEPPSKNSETDSK